jgi:transcriptional regulator with XRE-family HTH domain
MVNQWDEQMEKFGAFIRSQRKLANLSLRQLAELTSLSNPYLSELERGMHQPSVRVLKSLAGSLNVSAEMLLAHAGLLDHATDAAQPHQAEASPADTVEAVIYADGKLSDTQKSALIAVYHSMTKP